MNRKQRQAAGLPLVFAVAVVSILVGLSACSASSEEARVAQAMEALDAARQKYVTQGGGDVEGMLIVWKRIDVSDTPVDFQLAWAEALRAYEAVYNYMQTPRPGAERESVAESMARFDREVGKEMERTEERLEIVAGQYVPEIRQRYQQRKAVEAELMELWSAQQ